jgi:lysophospholipase L1-like esterase
VHKNNSFWIKAGRTLLVSVLLFSCSAPPSGYIILCAGDSITEVGYPPFLKSILKQEGVRAKVLNHGKSGHTSREYLGFLKENLAVMAESRPDFILLQLGTNDVRTDQDHTSAEAFYTNMKEIIRLFRDFATRSGKAPRILLATIPPIPGDTPFPFAPESADRIRQEINPLIQKLAKEEKLGLVDNFSVFLDSPHLLPEVHPSDQGYEAMAKNWHDALKKQGMRPVGKT